MLTEADYETIETLAKSLEKKLPYTAPELVSEQINYYVEIAYLRGRNAGIREALGPGGAYTPDPLQPLDYADLAQVQADDKATILEKRLCRDLEYLLLLHGVRERYRRRFQTGTP